MDWEELLAVALGLLNWSPEIFWNSSLFELACAIEGFNRANGGGKTMSRGGVEELKTFLAEMKKKGLA